MKFFFILFAGLFLLTTSAAAESSLELQILKEFFSLTGVENQSMRLTGGALEHYSRRPMVGEYLPKNASSTFRLLTESDTSAIYEAVVSHDDIAEVWSAFFQRGLLGSKLAAIKSLHIPPYLRDVEYKKLLAETGRTPAQSVRLIQLQRLFMPSDAFKEDFNKNLPTYETIAHLVETGKTEEAKTAAKEAGLLGVRLYNTTKSEGEMALLVNVVTGKGEKGGSQLGSEIRICGFLDNILGLLHLPTGVSPPEMSANDYIFIEALAENWYLFRNLAAEPLKEKSEK